MPMRSVVKLSYRRGELDEVLAYPSPNAHLQVRYFKHEEETDSFVTLRLDDTALFISPRQAAAIAYELIGALLDGGYAPEHVFAMAIEGSGEDPQAAMERVKAQADELLASVDGEEQKR